jgi:hypothetical protein
MIHSGHRSNFLDFLEQPALFVGQGRSHLRRPQLFSTPIGSITTPLSLPSLPRIHYEDIQENGHNPDQSANTGALPQLKTVNDFDAPQRRDEQSPQKSKRT